MNKKKYWGKHEVSKTDSRAKFVKRNFFTGTSPFGKCWILLKTEFFQN